MHNATSEPLIWTNRGNLLESSLKYTNGWQETEDATVFFEEWHLGDDLVKRNCHVRTKRGVTGEGAVGQLS